MSVLSPIQALPWEVGMQCTRLPFTTTAQPRAHRVTWEVKAMENHVRRLYLELLVGIFKYLRTFVNILDFQEPQLGLLHFLDFYILKIDFRYLKSGSRNAK